MLEEARELLQSVESESDAERKLAALEEALDLLDEADDSVLAANLRRSYTRRLIGQLFTLKKADIVTWFDYARVLLLRLQPEVDAALKADPDLKKRYEAFLALWPVDAAAALSKPGSDPDFRR